MCTIAWAFMKVGSMTRYVAMLWEIFCALALKLGWLYRWSATTRDIVCYLQKHISWHFQPRVSLELLGWLVPNFMPFIYTTSCTKLEENLFSSLQDICSWRFPCFLHIFLFLHCFRNVNLNQPKTTSLYIDFLEIWYVNKVCHGPSLLKIWRYLSWVWVSYEW